MSSKGYIFVFGVAASRAVLFDGLRAFSLEGKAVTKEVKASVSQAFMCREVKVAKCTR